MSVSLLPNQLSNAKLRVSVAWGADPAADPGTWTFTDITTDVLQDNGNGINITVGRQNEFSTAAPAQCTVRLKNQGGAYTPFNPGSTNYPNVQLGTPVRVEVSLDGGSTWDTRFQGEAASWRPSWDAGGRFAYVALTAAGVTRRLGSGSKPLRSPLTRAILFTTSATLKQYWPCEDLSAASQAASGLSGGSAMTASGTVRFGAMDYANQSDFTLLPGTTFGLQPQPQLKEGGSLTGSCSGGSSSAWTVQAAVFCNPITDDTTVVLFQWTEGGRTWQVTSDGITADSVSLLVNGSAIASEPHIMINEDVRIDASQSGGNINWSFKPMLAHAAITGSFTGNLAAVDSFTANPNNSVTDGSLSVGQVRIWDGNTAPDFKTSTQDTSAWNGYPNEAADVRIPRLCAEEGIALDLVGQASTAMGTQTVDSLMNLLRQCEATDVGVLLDGLGPGLTYVTRDHVLNNNAVLTVDANAGQVPTVGPQPAHDDQLIRNRVTVTNANGSTVTAEKEAGTLGTATIGVWDDSHAVNAAADAGLPNIAGWLVHLGTVEGMRYPQIPLDFAAAPEQAADWVSMIPADRVDLTNLSDHLTQHPTGDVALSGQGWSEFLSARQWRATVNCSSYLPNQVAILEETFRLELAGQTLGADLAPGATTVSIATASGHQLFTTSSARSGDFPLDLNVAGWKIHLTSNTDGTTPQVAVCDATPNTATIPSGTTVTLWRPAPLAL